MSFRTAIHCFGQASLLAFIVCSTSAHAQAAQDSAVNEPSDADIVVTARRRGELAQDVPLVVNSVSSDRLNKLSIRQFEDIAALVPGLNMSRNANGIGANTSVRGVNFDVAASGSNGTVEFYMNDAPISSLIVFNSLFDLAQVEVLRGPQGTLRGRASPSGSITITTHRPDLYDYGGYANATATDIGGINLQGAVNVPIIKGVLALRFAGLADDNEGTRVHSVNDLSEDPSTKSRAFRASAVLQPVDGLELSASYQRLTIHNRSFEQRESANLFNPALAASPVTIRAEDRLGVFDTPRLSRNLYEIYNWQAEWRVAGQKLNYVGGFSRSDGYNNELGDPGDFFGPAFPSAYGGFARRSHILSKQESHELRLSSEEMLFGMVDYVVGGLINRLESPTDFVTETPFFAVARAVPTPADGLPTVCVPNTTTCSGILRTPILRTNRSIERSLFGNVVAHLGSATELSGGIRYIRYEQLASLTVSGIPDPRAAQNDKFQTAIYSASLKHRFSDDLMAYASFGSSWRPGITVIGDFSLTKGDLESQFLLLPPEKSRSYEIGIKSNWLQNRLTLNIAAFHQDFDNFPYRVPGSGVFYASTDLDRFGAPQTTVKNFNFVGAVPVKVNGVEVEASFRANSHFSFAGSASYALGKIQNGVVPCNDYFPADGVPDSTANVPTLSQIQASAPRGANGAPGTVSGCRVNYRSSFASPFSATAQAEYARPVMGDTDAYVRGLLSYYGRSQNDPSNGLDDVSAYALLNMFVGVRDQKGAWEIALYGKNPTGTERVLSRTSAPLITSYATLLGSQVGTSSYREITYTPPREFGINVRYAFGSR